MSLQVAVSGAGFSGSGTTIDMSGGGMLIAIKAPETLAGTDVSLDVQRVGKLTARVLAATNLGLHLQFTGLGAEAHARVVAEIEACKAQDVGYIARAVETAKRVALAFEGALDDRRISEASLFDTLYVPVPDTDPEQVTSGATATCEALLPGIIDPAKESDSKIVFCIACDRNGYIPVHNREYSQPQRPGQRDWNIAHSRNRRLFTDRAALLAARNTEPHIVQSYLREMGGGVTVPLKEFDAPILVSGRHWGAIRLAVTP